MKKLMFVKKSLWILILSLSLINFYEYSPRQQCISSRDTLSPDLKTGEDKTTDPKIGRIDDSFEVVNDVTLSEIKICIFDWDDTLFTGIDWRQIEYQQIVEVLSAGKASRGQIEKIAKDWVTGPASGMPGFDNYTKTAALEEIVSHYKVMHNEVLFFGDGATKLLTFRVP